MSKLLLAILISCTLVYGITDITRYVNTASSGGNGTTNATSGANAAFTHLSTCMTTNVQDLTSGDKRMTVYCSGASSDVNYVSIGNDWTTSATNTINIIGDRVYTLSVTNNDCINIGVDYVTLDSLNLRVIPTTGNFECIYVSKICNIKNIIADCEGTSTNSVRFISVMSSSANPVNIWNCISYTPSTATYASTNATGIYITSGVVNVYSSTIINGYRAFLADGGGTLITKNCYGAHIVSGGTDYSVTSMTTCASSDITGSVGLQSIAYSSTTGAKFISITDGSQNLLPIYSSPLIDAGTNTSGDPAPLNFTTDIRGIDRPFGPAWDIGGYEWWNTCPPSWCLSKTIVDTVGNTGSKYGHIIFNSFDSVKMIGTWPDSFSMLAYTSKDTVRYGKLIKKYAKAAYQLRTWSCSDSTMKTNMVDTIMILGWSGSYLTSPLACTLNVTTVQTISSTAMADSFTFSGLPSGSSGNQNNGTITWTPSAIVAKTGAKVIAWRKGVKEDSTYDTLYSVYKRVVIDSVRPSSGVSGSIISVYCKQAGNTQGSSGIIMGDSAATILSWSDTLVRFYCPNIDTGLVDFFLSDGYTTDSLTAGFRVQTSTIPSYTLTMAVSHGGTTVPTVGTSTVDSGSTTSISHTAANGYAFKSWHISGAAVHIADTTVNSMTVWLSGNGTITANDTVTDSIQDSVVITSRYIQTDTIRTHYLRVASTDSAIFNKPIIVRDSIVYMPGCIPVGQVGSYVQSTPGYTLTVKLNGFTNTPRVINKSKIKWR